MFGASTERKAGGLLFLAMTFFRNGSSDVGKREADGADWSQSLPSSPTGANGCLQQGRLPSQDMRQFDSIYEMPTHKRSRD